MLMLERCRKILPVCAAATLLTVGCTHMDDKAPKGVLAIVNDYRVQSAEVDKSYERQIFGAPQKPQPVEEQGLRLNLLRQIIDLRLQLQRAQRLSIAASSDEVDAKLKQASAPYTKEEFEKRLKELNFTEDEYKEDVRRNLTIQKLVDREVGSKVTVADADIDNYYNQHKPDFNLNESRYHIAHIFVGNGPETPSTSGKVQNDAQALRKVQMVWNRLEAGEDFAELANRYSDDENTRSKGGELGAVPESQLKGTDAATREAVLKLKPGQFSKPLPVMDPQTRRLAGYRIVRVSGKDAAGQRELGDPAVQQWIRNHLRDQREQVLKEAYYDVLHNGATIRNYYAQQILENQPQR